MPSRSLFFNRAKEGVPTTDLFFRVTVNSVDYELRRLHQSWGVVANRKLMFGFSFDCKRSCSILLREPLSDNEETNDANLKVMVHTVANVLLENRICPGCNKLSTTDVCEECSLTINTTACTECGVSFGSLKDGMHKWCNRAAKRRRLE